MKKLTILLIFLAHFCFLWSNSVDEETIRKAAKCFMDEKRPSSNTIVSIVPEYYEDKISFYAVNFEEGGWVLISAYRTTVPVLSYNLIGAYHSDDQKPDAFMYFIDLYHKKISKSSLEKSSNILAAQKWDELLSKAKFKFSYTAGDQLLDITGRGHVRWNQSYNWDANCSPVYNEFFPSGGSGCVCDNVPAGCGPVAMGQIMWYWKWPESSSYRTYDWDIMPSVIYNSTNQTYADEIAHLLDDIGNEVNVWESCAGTMSTVSNIEDAFNDVFAYEAAKKYIKNDWLYGSAWEDLLRSEIDNGRPVLYRGDKSDLSTSKHIFVIDGYDSSDPDFFWFNFGWGYYGNTSYNTSRHYLNDITPGTHDYTDNQMAVVGISPTYYSPVEVNITDVTYSSVSGVKSEDAQQSISLPASGKSLSVESGGEYTLVAGSSITLNSGFEAKLGGTFKAEINTSYQPNMDITVTAWTNYFSAANSEELCFIVDNADSWEFEACTLGGSAVFQSAGTISSSTVCVWDGSGSSTGYYTCYIRFKNNYGRYVENSYNVFVIN